MIARFDIPKRRVFKIISLILLFPFGCMLTNYVLLSLLWLGRYLGTFLRMLYALVC